MLVGLEMEDFEAQWNATVLKFSYHPPHPQHALSAWSCFAAVLQLHCCKQGHAGCIAACLISGLISGINECSPLQRQLGL